MTLGGRRVAVERPPGAHRRRPRGTAGTSYEHFAADDMLTLVVLERMLAGVATRRHARAASRSASRWSSKRNRTAVSEGVAGSVVDLVFDSPQIVGVKVAMLVPFGKYWRSRPLVFSLVPRCHGSL